MIARMDPNVYDDEAIRNDGEKWEDDEEERDR